MSPHSPEEPLVVWWVLPGTDVWEGRLVRNPPSSPSPSEWLKQRLHLLVLVFCITLLITQKLRMGPKEFFCLEKAISCHSLTPRHSQTYFLRRGIFSKKNKNKTNFRLQASPHPDGLFLRPRCMLARVPPRHCALPRGNGKWDKWEHEHAATPGLVCPILTF